MTTTEKTTPLPIFRLIQYFGRTVAVGCDARCDKAWGGNQRPRVQVSEDEDDYAFLADHELGDAPVNPETYEGGYGKPRPGDPYKLNRWCVRECERSTIVDDSDDPSAVIRLKDFSKRRYNCPSSDPSNKR